MRYDPIAKILKERAGIFDRLERARSDLERYRFLQDNVWLRDVAECPAYQRMFNGLYMVRRNTWWRAQFYAAFEQAKLDAALSFDRILHELFARTNRVEASFASKLAATLRPSLPVYDSFVRQNLRLPPRKGALDKRLALLSEDYAHIADVYSDIISSASFSQLKHEFDTRLPAYAAFTDVKKLDLLLWQLR